MTFDAYESWLGIPADRRPPTYYDLLGLPRFESDPETIEQAGLRRMNKVRQHQIGIHGELSQEILGELARARLVLGDPERRAAYDAKLRADLHQCSSRPAESEVDCEGDASCDAIETIDDVPDALHLIAISGLELHDSINLRGNVRRSSSILKKRLGTAAFWGSHVAVIYVFWAHGRDIAEWCRSNFQLRMIPPPAAAPELPQAPGQTTDRPVPSLPPVRPPRKMTKPRGEQAVARWVFESPADGSIPNDAGNGHGGEIEVEPEPPLDGAADRERGDEGEQANENRQDTAQQPLRPEEVLKKHGLRQVGDVYVLENETEVRKTAAEIQRLQGELITAQGQQLRNEDLIIRYKAATDEAINYLRTAINQTKQAYEELGEDNEIATALASLAKNAIVKPKLEPSAEFVRIRNWLDKRPRRKTGSRTN